MKPVTASFCSGSGCRSSARRSRLAGHGSPLNAASGAAETFSIFQVSFGVPPRSLETSHSQKPAVAFPKAVIPFPKPAATFRPAAAALRKVTVHLPKVTAHGRKAAAPFGKVTVHGRKVAAAFRPGTAAFPPFSVKTPRFCQNTRFLPVLGRFLAGQPSGSHFPTFRKSTVS